MTLAMDYICETRVEESYEFYTARLKGPGGAEVFLRSHAVPNDPFYPIQEGKSYRVTVEEIPADERIPESDPVQ